MIIQNISLLLFIFTGASSTRLSLRGNILSIDRNKHDFFLRHRRVTDHEDISANHHHAVSEVSGENQMTRMVLDDTQTIPVIIYPFTLTISPTAQPLQQFQIDEIGDAIESLVFKNLSRSGDAGLSLVSSVQLSGVSSVTFTPSEKIDDWRTKMPKSDLEFKAGVAQTYYSIYHDTPSPNQLAMAVESIMKQDLIANIRANVNGLEWIQVVDVKMHLPYSTLSPTASHIQPTLAPIMSPSNSPSLIESLDPTILPTVSSAEPTFFPTTQKPSSSGQSSTAAPTIALVDDWTTKPTFEKKAFNNDNNISSNNDFQDGGNKSENAQIKASAIWGAISCTVLILGFAVMRMRRNRRIVSKRSTSHEKGFISDNDSSHEDGDSTLTPDTMDGCITPKSAQDDCEVSPPIPVERLHPHDVSLNESREASVEIDCNATRIHGSYTSLPSDFYESPANLEDEATAFQCREVSQKEMLPLQNFPIAIQQNEQSQTPELALSSEPNENSPTGCSAQKLNMMSHEIPTLYDFFSPCTNVFRGDVASDCDQDDKSSVHLNPLATSSVFEHFDESAELWDTEGDDSSVLESSCETASNAGSVRRSCSDESVGEGEDNEFVLDDSWDPDDTDSSSESPSFGSPQFEPVYEQHGLRNCSDEPDDDIDKKSTAL
jgi:hypothetical protein